MKEQRCLKTHSALGKDKLFGCCQLFFLLCRRPDPCMYAVFFHKSSENSHMRFPNATFTIQVDTECRQHHGLFHYALSPRQPNLLEFTWCNQDGMYFISITFSLAEAEPIFCKHIQQIDPTPNAEPVRNTLLIPEPRVSKNYYDYCGHVDQHN